MATLPLEPVTLAQVNPSWIATGSLNIPRSGQTATLLRNGKVLAVGGRNGNSLPNFLNSAELYDPVTGAWTVTGSLNAPRYLYTATLLANGQVLVGGGDTNIGILNGAELYNSHLPAPVDFDGDGKSDIAVYLSGIWYILRSSDGAQTAVGWGGPPQDKPVPADYDGDGKVDQAVYRDGVWFILRSSDGGGMGITWGGAPEDIPLK